MSSEPVVPWHLLILSLPTESATARMRIWRALKTLGCAALRDGAYLLPPGATHQTSLEGLAEACLREGGSAWVMAVLPASAGDAAAYEALFDRRDDYALLRRSWRDATTQLADIARTADTAGNAGTAEQSRLLRKLQRELDALRAIDFFPGDASTEAASAWADFTQRLARLRSPGEPRGVDERQRPRLDPKDYQGRVWATRRQLWVDRVASAWLIRRFIDPAARFRWLAEPADCPRTALGFDFDGAAFSHVGERVTFETLAVRFGLDADPALARLGAMVHALDVGGEPVAEGAGFEAVLGGAQARLPDDDALLAEISGVLDSLYAHFKNAALPGVRR